MALKFNPFRPNHYIHPGMFVGRLSEIDKIEQCIFQAKHGRPQHFLVRGERGIGKTSLLRYVAGVSSGGISIPDQQIFKFLTVSVDLSGCQTQLEIIEKIGRGLKTELGREEQTKTVTREFLSWLSNWELLGVRYHKQDILFDTEEVSEALVENLAAFCNGTDVFDGVSILIDEADSPGVEAGLGVFLKMLTERLSARGCDTVFIGLAGLPSLLEKLRESHESSPRLFQILTLKPLEDEERKLAVNIGLDEANGQNQILTEITEEALQKLADLSEGYPHFVQQFAYCAFEHDTDNVIDLNDVEDGAFGEDGALEQLGDKFFNEMYHARVSSEDYRRVLDTMADSGDKWVSRKSLLENAGVSESSMNNALKALKSKEIILQDDSRRGFYRLPTNSFAAWINAFLTGK